ncbi:MAG: Holliday junction resolvase RuvX [Oscillospiraceae bacterium]|jgi:putative Holliday junction resolvase|nr:Holliday junction resolvase RuvX [Oscillospiraceae bacterium]
MAERMLALDVGDRRVGVAVSDELGVLAQPVETYERVGYGPDVRHIAQIAEHYRTTRVLCGLPRNMDGSLGFQAEKVMAFSGQLQQAGLRVEYWDERLTTRAAHSSLMTGGMRRKDRKQVVDQVAAMLILQSWLDAGGVRSPSATGRAPEEEISMDERQNAPDEQSVQDGQEDNVVELVDEQGETVRFAHLMTLEHKGESYVILTALENTSDSQEDEVFILRIDQDDQGEDCYVTVDDEDVMQAVFDEFVAICEQDDAAEEESGEEV